MGAGREDKSDANQCGDREPRPPGERASRGRSPEQVPRENFDFDRRRGDGGDDRLGELDFALGMDARQRVDRLMADG